MDKRSLEILKRLREILMNVSLEGYAHKRHGLTWKQLRHFRKMLEKLADTLFEECILKYEVRKQFQKEIRELIKSEED